MSRKYCCVIGITIAVIVLFFAQQGLCQEKVKDEITWDDLTGPNSEKSLPEIPTVIKTPALAVPRDEDMVVIPESTATEIEVAPESKPQPEENISQGPVSSPVVSPGQSAVISPKVAAKAAGKALKEKTGHAVEKKAAASASKEQKAASPKIPPKEETPWQQATSITSAEPASARDTFIINPDRE